MVPVRDWLRTKQPGEVVKVEDGETGLDCFIQHSDEVGQLDLVNCGMYVEAVLLSLEALNLMVE